MAKVELVKAKAFEIDPNKKYIIVFDKSDISTEDVWDLRDEIERWGARDYVSVMTGDTSRVKVVEL